jgi:hypothetical protein
VLSFQKDVPRFEDDAHPALAQTLLELEAAVQNWLAHNGRLGLNAVIRTIIDVVSETVTTGWALFHSLILILRKPRAGSGCSRLGF